MKDTIKSKIITFIKTVKKIDLVDESLIFVDGYQLFYNGDYIGNIQNLIE